MSETGTEETVEHVFDEPDAESAADLRMLRVVEGYAALVGATIERIEPHLLELTLPTTEAQYFRGGRTVTIAFSTAALERSPNAEMAVVGSAFLEDLLDAVRARGFRLSHGLIPPTVAPTDEAARLTVPIERASVQALTVTLALHVVGKLVARVAIKAGAIGEEQIVESGMFDLTSGVSLSPDVVACCVDVQRAAVPAADPAHAAGAKRIAVRATDELLPLMFEDLQATLRNRLDQRRTDAERALGAEFGRLDRYYGDLLQEAAEGGDDLALHDRRAIELERDRRKAEESRRYEVRISVHPIQLREFQLLVQRAEWVLTTPSGLKGVVAGHRALSGTGAWAVACPTCGKAPRALRVCCQGHATCPECSQACAVCHDAFCEKHGIAACHVDGRPACSGHARRCPTCRREHCSDHEGECSEGLHKACTACLALCGVCGRVVCTTHGLQSKAEAPKGARRLCSDCVVYCEGGTNEPVGRDEAVRCASCEKSVCSHHQAVCAVDGQVHCSKHLRRADRSRRLTCEHHRAQCGQEPEMVFGSDEIQTCGTCGNAICGDHGAVCAVDKVRHCTTHLARLHDTVSDSGCEKHRSLCHVDQQTFSVAGTSPCPACERATCAVHVRPCGWCGRRICLAELPARQVRCETCRQMTEAADPTDALIAASVAANGGEPPKAKSWQVARDATHQVVDLDLGWSRRLVFAVRHGDNTPQTIMRHSLLGSSQER